MFVEVSIKLPDSVSINPLIEIGSRMIKENHLAEARITFYLHVASATLPLLHLQYNILYKVTYIISYITWYFFI